ncbi:hypothetical protein O3P69_016375 [Scylla paramamosain]|uniref:Transmembrane protein 98 n=1 Tax=Scylla paramamosain TaxID=85552 RepID=A0AAW0TGE8_SCYPA
MEMVETLVAVALGVLAAVFLGSLAALALVCFRRALNAKHRLFYNQDIRPEVLLSGGEVWSELELDDVHLAPQIDKILNDAQWVDDATGLIPHCLAILKLCHQLAERLVATTMSPIHSDRLHDIIEVVTRRLSPRIDDVARAMYPPLDPRLLEARCSALVLSLTLLAWHARQSTSGSTVTLINEALKDMDHHLSVLREAAMSHETFHGVFKEEAKCDPAEC